MSFWRNLFGSPVAPLMASPYAAPSDAIVTLAAADFLTGLSDAGQVTRDIALRVGGVKRAHRLHCSIVAGLPFFEMDNAERTVDQPGWLTSSRSGIAPYQRMYGVTSDLFMSGWACIGITDDRSDALHIPAGCWGVDRETGQVQVAESIPPEYRARPVAIQLGYGDNGILIDGRDTLVAARNIERVWMERVENPAPATNLHITDERFDTMTRKESRRIVDDWNENRRRGGGQTAVTKSFVDVKGLGETSPDLFEKGRNALRLDLANHAAVPASIIEGARDGSGSDINYSNDAAKRNELYDYGTKAFVQAIEARLSLDDVCDPGLSIRADLTSLMAVPSPTTNPTSED